jgi:acid phosphatase
VPLDGLYFNASYPGPLSDKKFTPGWWPSPDTTAKCASGHGVLQSIVDAWGKQDGTYNYTNVYPYDAVANVETSGTLVTGSNDGGNSSTSTSGGNGGSGSGSGSGSGTSSSPSPSSSHNAATAPLRAGVVGGVVGVIGFAAALL